MTLGPRRRDILWDISFLRLLPFLLKITGTCGLLFIASLAAGRKHASASRRSRRFFLPGAPILVFLPRLLIIYREAMKFGQINMFFYSFIWGEYLSAMLDKPINGVRQKTDVFSQIRKKQGGKTWTHRWAGLPLTLAMMLGIFPATSLTVSRPTLSAPTPTAHAYRSWPSCIAARSKSRHLTCISGVQSLDQSGRLIYSCWPGRAGWSILIL